MTDPLSHREIAIEPDIPIIDAHHHIWDDITNPLATPYPLDRLAADLAGGHDIVATVYAECTSHWRTSGPVASRPVGETEWITRQHTDAGVMAGIIGYADLRPGAAARPVLDEHVAAGAGRFRGIRHSTAWDPHPDVPNTAREVPPGTLVSTGFIEGVRLLGDMGLVFDAWMFFHQLPELVELSRAAPDASIVLNHLGGPIALGPYAADRPAMLREWREGLRRAAQCDNVVLKVGGLGFPWFVDAESAARLGSSDALAAHWRPEVQFAIETFGPDRCVLESNFPVDSAAADYVTLWNTFKKLTAEYSAAERAELFAGTAARVYALDLLVP